MAHLQLEGPAGTLRGQAVRFCSVCCRFNTLPGPLCAICRTTQGHAMGRPLLSFPIRRRMRDVARILAAVASLAVIAGAVVSGLPMAAAAIAFYAALVALAGVTVRSLSGRPCPECGSRRSSGEAPRFAAPGVPLIGTSDKCSACRTPRSAHLPGRSRLPQRRPS